jgi:ribosomal protein RSM22 (predicted rRNA methylase)
MIQVEDALWAAAGGRLPAAVLLPGRLAQAVAERTRRYTSERERLAEPLSGEAGQADLAARALFFSVTDSAKVDVPLGELAGRGLLPATPLRLLDLGAGAGAMSLGAAAFLARIGRPVDLDVVAIDRDPAALALLVAAASHLESSLGGRIRVAARTDDLDRCALGGDHDLVLMGGVLNELADGWPLVERALAATARHGALVIVEPALRATSRALHRIRDRLLGTGHIFAPCTRTGPCPALLDERDWCHEDRPIALAPRAGQIAAMTGLRDSGLKFSYLVVRREPAPLVAPPPGRAAVRVVSEPVKRKGRRELTACGDTGWVALRLLTRHRGEATRPFERARRGDVLLVPAPAADRDIGPADAIERLTPSSTGD